MTPFIGISNIEAPANKLGTIKEAICPISCSFDAYRSREVYRDVSSICNSVLTFQLQKQTHRMNTRSYYPQGT